MSIAKQLATALNARIATIKKANGYLTDIGSGVFNGRTEINVSELPCAVIVEGDDRVVSEGPSSPTVGVKQVKMAQRFIIEGHTTCNPLNPNDACHDIVEDLQRACFAGDRAFGLRGIVKGDEMAYNGKNFGERPDGTDIIAASIEIEIVYIFDLTKP